MTLHRTLLVAATASASLFGCFGNERYEMGETIAMGPFSFRVESASASVEYEEGKPRRIIQVQLWQLSVEPGEDDDLAGFLTPGSEFAPRPQIEIRDREGHEYPGRVGLRRGDRWPVSFELVEDAGFTDASRERADRFAEQQLGKGPRDFRLYITNPDRREGQPREIWLQLKDYLPTR